MNRPDRSTASLAPPPTALLPGADGSDAARRIPLWLKIVYTGFMAVLIPIYWHQYGPTNFLYFCDVALFLLVAGIWTENRLLVSLPAVGILLPQSLWVADFAVQLTGHQLSGMSGYMFDAYRSLFLRWLSLFHGWLPFLIVYLVWRLGYDRRAFPIWTALAWSLCLICYFLLPSAGAELANPLTPHNVNYVFGFDDAQPQQWMSAGAYLAAWMTVLLVVVFIPTHCLLRKWFDPDGRTKRAAS